jgi:carboxymethylenebutenolidase
MPVPGEVTDRTRISETRVQLDTQDGTIDAYVARPAGSVSPRPGIIVIHEAFGPVEHIDDIARRFADAGFDVVAPNLYTREGAPDPSDFPSVFEKMFGVPDSRAVSDLEAAAAHLRSLETSNGKVGCIGFCSGGRQTLLFACSSDAVDAAAPCWGGFIDRATPDAETTETRPTTVLDLAGRARCPVYLVGGALDANPSPEVLAEAEQRIAASGQPVTLEVFADAGHAFLADYRDSYQPEAAADLWPKLVAFFKANLDG